MLIGLLMDFFRSGALVFRRNDRTTVLVIDKLALLLIIPMLGVGLLLAIFTDLPNLFLRYFLSAIAIVLLVSVFSAFNYITITSSGIMLKFIYGFGLGRWTKLAYSGGRFSHNPLGGFGGEVLYNEPREAFPGMLLVPLEFYAFFPKGVASVLNEEILRVSGSSVPRAVVTFSKESAS